MRDLLFIRKYPSHLSGGYFEGLMKSANSVFRRNGQVEVIGGHRVIFFFPGYGKHTRNLPDEIIKNINSGAISDIVDFGAGGALDPVLKLGDLVLSAGEVCCDGGSELIDQKRRPQVEGIVRKIADDEGRNFYKKKILTASKVISRRLERLKYYECTGAGVVQMEHFGLSAKSKDW